MVENNKPQFEKKVIDFLSDDLFIYWRINPTQELNNYWENFLIYNPQSYNQLQHAIREFEEIRMGTYKFRGEQLQLQQKIEKSLHSYKKKRKKFTIYYSSTAAAVALLLIVSMLLFTNKNNFSVLPKEVLVLGNTISNNEVKLLSGGETVSLQNNSTLDLSATHNSVIIQDSLSQRELKLQGNTINKLITPYGKRSSLILADGSKVWLNSGTEIEFPAVFSGSSREIRINGEIFIEVQKQNKPFIIHTLNSSIQVLGTSFNISAYKDDTIETVVLVEGSLQVKNTKSNAAVVLVPDQMAEIENNNITSKAVNISEYISWKNGFIQLNKAPLDEVLRKVGRYYNVEFRYSKNVIIHNRTCSGKLFLSEDIQDVLTAFTGMTLLNYEKDDKIIYIKK